MRRNPPGALWCLVYTPAVARRLIAGLIPAPPFPLLSSALLLLLLLPSMNYPVVFGMKRAFSPPLDRLQLRASHACPARPPVPQLPRAALWRSGPAS